MLAKFNTDINFLGQNMWSDEFSESHKRQFSNHRKHFGNNIHQQHTTL